MFSFSLCGLRDQISVIEQLLNSNVWCTLFSDIQHNFPLQPCIKIHWCTSIEDSIIWCCAVDGPEPRQKNNNGPEAPSATPCVIKNVSAHVEFWEKLRVAFNPHSCTVRKKVHPCSSLFIQQCSPWGPWHNGIIALCFKWENLSSG